MVPKTVAVFDTLGVAGAFLAMGYTLISDTGINFFFGDTGTDWWTGKWWWIPLTAFGGFLVAQLRRGWEVPEKVPGGVGILSKGWINPSLVLKLVTIALVSTIFGAALGPSYGIILLGGGLGAWIVTKLKYKNEVIKQDYMLTGTAGALGGAFSAPIFAAIMTSEMSPTKKKNYVTAFIPQIIAAIIGGVIFFGITGAALFGSFTLPQFEYEVSQLFLAVIFGLVASIVLLVFVSISAVAKKAMSKVHNLAVRGAVGGAVVGLIIFALPLAAGSGVGQLTSVIDNPGAYGAVFLVMVLLAKMLAIAISLQSGFLGGNVFPIMFIGGITGVIVNAIFPEIPLSLAVASMLAAVPGAYLKAPLTLMLISVGTVGLLFNSAIPIAISIAVAYITTNAIKSFAMSRKTASS